MLSAFEAAYPKHGPKPMHRKRSMAKRIFAQKGTQLAIKELTEDVRRAEKLTVESHMAKLGEIGEAAYKDGKWTAALKAEELRGKCAGFYVERSMNVSVTTSVDQIKSQMEALLEQHPQMAQVMGVESPRILLPTDKNQGIPLETEPSQLKSLPQEPLELPAQSDQSYSQPETGEDMDIPESDSETWSTD